MIIQTNKICGKALKQTGGILNSFQITTKQVKQPNNRHYIQIVVVITVLLYYYNLQ